MEGEHAEHWDRLGPSTPSHPTLFSVDDTAEHLRADVEDARQRATIAASGEAGRLGLLLAAESAGALVAAEMTWAGVPWRVDVHERLLTDLLGPRPPRGARPQGLEALVADVRRAFDAPGLNPDSRPELLAALRRADLEVADTRASSLRELDHPGIEPLLRYKQLAHLFQTNGWTWIDQWVSGGRFRPSYQPAGSSTGRWSSNGGGALSFPVQVRPAAVADDGWTFVVADVAQLEPRVLAGMSGDRALARSARGADLYQGMVDDGAVASRNDAKLGLLGAMYGATSGESGRMVAGLTRRYPDAFGLVETAARAGEHGQVVRTLLGRGSPGLGEAWDRVLDDGPPIPTARPVSAAPTAASPATSWCRAPVPSGRCAGSPTCATGCGAWAAPAPWSTGRTWSSSSTTRSSCTPRPPSPTRSPRMPPRRPRPPPACCSATSASTSRSTSRSCSRTPTPASRAHRSLRARRTQARRTSRATPPGPAGRGPGPAASA